MSSGKFSDDHRRYSAERWARALRKNFASPAQVAKAWSVDDTTAAKWWDGKHQPLLWVAAKAIDTPELQPVMRDFEAMS